MVISFPAIGDSQNQEGNENVKSRFHGVDRLSRSFTPGKKQASVVFADTFPRELCHVSAASSRPEVFWLPQPEVMALDGLLPSLPFAGHKASSSAGGNCAGVQWLEPAQSLFSNNGGGLADAPAT